MNVTVVGAGPAGLATAYRLGRDPAARISVIERAPFAGGLAAGFRHGDCVLDVGPHRLHGGIDPSVLDDLQKLLGDELETRRRHGLIRVGGRWLPYPPGPDTLLALGPVHAARYLAGLIEARFLPERGDSTTFEGALVARLGRPLYDAFYRPFAEKVWGLPGSEIAAEQAERRVNQRGLADLVRAALGRGAARTYFYPRGGFGRIPAAYASALDAMPGVELRLDASIEGVEWRDDRIVEVAPAQAPDQVVWTAPLGELVRLLRPAAPPDVVEAASGLRFRALVMCYLVLARANVGSADTYYFPERRFPFNRVAEQKRFSEATVPADRTVLAMDIACDPDDETWRASDEAIAALVLPALREAGLVGRAETGEVFTRRFRSAYPLYDLRAAGRVARVRQWLSRFTNLWLIGRQGLYLHNNTHHSLLMGYRAADAISEGDRAGWLRRQDELAAGLRVAD